MRLPVEFLIEKYKDNIYSAAYNVCGDPQDAEDITQETFIKYYRRNEDFESEEHVKAWLLRVAINQAKSMAVSFWRRNRVSIQEYMAELAFEAPEDAELFEAVMALPQKYRIVVHLHYFEDYSVKEMAEVLKTSENTIKTRLARGRKLLKERLKEAWNEYE